MNEYEKPEIMSIPQLIWNAKNVIIQPLNFLKVIQCSPHNQVVDILPGGKIFNSVTSYILSQRSLSSVRIYTKNG